MSNNPDGGARRPCDEPLQHKCDATSSAAEIRTADMKEK